MNSITMMDQSINLVIFLAIILSIISIILAVLLVWISLTFYRLTTENLDKNNKAAELIKNNTNHMGDLFEKFYLNLFVHAAQHNNNTQNNTQKTAKNEYSEDKKYSTIPVNIMTLIKHKKPLTLSRLFTHQSLKNFPVSEVEHEIKMLEEQHLISIFGPLNRSDTVVIPYEDAEEAQAETEK